ncbi:hypothetical protein F5148DRAFT_1186264, partial [Russula earlei]
MSQCRSLLVILLLHMLCKHPHSTCIWSSVPYISYKQPFPSPWRLKKLELVHTCIWFLGLCITRLTGFCNCFYCLVFFGWH